MGRGKIVFVDFAARRADSRQPLRSAKLVCGVFAVSVLLLISLAAALLPTAIGTPMFAPTVVLVAALSALGVGQASRTLSTWRGRSRAPLAAWEEPNSDRGPTLH